MIKDAYGIGGDLKLYVIAREICSWRYSNGRRH